MIGWFGGKSMHLHYLDTDSYVISIKTKDIIKDMKILETYLNSLSWLIWQFEWKSRTFSNKDKKWLENSKRKLLRRFGLMNLFAWVAKCMRFIESV